MRRLTGAVILVVLGGCGGDPFGQDSPAGDDLAGAPSSAGSIGTGGAVMPSGGAASSSGRPSSNEGGRNEAGDSAAGASQNEPAAPTPCERAGWSAEAFASSTKTTETPAAALDGSLTSRWSSGTPQAEGQWFEVKLGQGVELAGLELRTPEYPSDVPAEVKLIVDGAEVAATLTAEAGLLGLDFAPRSASLIRLELVGADSLNWWSIGEVNALCR